jgi:hypothetical protein
MGPFCSSRPTSNQLPRVTARTLAPPARRRSRSLLHRPRTAPAPTRLRATAASFCTASRAAHESASHPHAASLLGTRASAPGPSRVHFLRDMRLHSPARTRSLPCTSKPPAHAPRSCCRARPSHITCSRSPPARSGSPLRPPARARLGHHQPLRSRAHPNRRCAPTPARPARLLALLPASSHARCLLCAPARWLPLASRDARSRAPCLGPPSAAPPHQRRPLTPPPGPCPAPARLGRTLLGPNRRLPVRCPSRRQRPPALTRARRSARLRARARAR